MAYITGRGRYVDLTGKVFNRLTVIKRIPRPDYISENSHDAYWLCKCSCMSDKDVISRSTDLKSGTIGSCGCWQQESRHYHSKKYNTYDLTGDYGVGYTEESLEFYFDIEDYCKIKDYYWSVDKDGYIYNILHRIGLHRLVTECPKGYQVDHINHIEKDNRKSNLRIVTNQLNQRNKGIGKANKTGCTGVRRKNNRYSSYITIDSKYIHLGTFKKYEDAVKARIEAEDKYYGEYSYRNSMKLSKQIKGAVN